MKPHLFIALHYMEIGGAETALIGLLNALDPERVNVDLFIYDHRGEMMQFIPNWVNLLPSIPQYTVLERPIVELVRRGFWGIAAARLWAKVLAKRAYSNSESHLENVSGLDKMSKCTTPLLPKINPSVTYDLAISFLAPHRIVLDKVNAKKKIAWIHTDYTSLWVDTKEEMKVWSRYNHIASISDGVTKAFLQIFPSLKDKIIKIENIISPSLVRERAELQDVSNEMQGDIKLLSIGRFSKTKNFESIPDICKRVINHLINNHSSIIDIRWYIIGYGGNEPIIRQKIKDAGMADHVIILGKKENPYPYIKACDIYVQPSLYEGKSVTVREAQILCKPVVVTNYPTSKSQLQDGIDGIIVPLDNEGCAKSLFDFIIDIETRNNIIHHLQSHDYGYKSEISKIYNLWGQNNIQQ